MLVTSQLWDELWACGFSQLTFKSVREMQASKYEADLEQELQDLLPCPAEGCSLPHPCLWSRGCGQTLQQWSWRGSRSRDSYKDA